MTRPQLSLRHEYELYIEAEIEDYKDSVSRSTLLAIGDEAAAALATQPQMELTELVLWEEVDRIITRRLGLPSYQQWRRKRLKVLAEYRKPEHWGLRPDAPVVKAIQPGDERRVLLAGEPDGSAALYLAAHGCDVTAVESEELVVERVLRAAGAAGLTQRVRGCVADLGSYSPDETLHAVVCTPAAFAGLSRGDRERVISLLQTATADGGVHLVETIVAGQASFTIDELRSRYAGWAISLDCPDGGATSFVARKTVA